MYLNSNSISVICVLIKIILFIVYIYIYIGSLNLICVPLGCMISGILTQPFGRKPSMIALTCPFILAWLILYFSTTVTELYLALALCGLCGGLLEAPVSIFQCTARENQYVLK